MMRSCASRHVEASVWRQLFGDLRYTITSCKYYIGYKLMTTSPPVSSKQEKPAQTQTLLSDRAASIGWYFIESYYEFFTKNPENIFKLYHVNSSLCHSGFPLEVDETRVLHKAHGVESIRKRFQDDERLNRNNINSIVITSADIHVSLQENILIVVFGEWSKDHSPYYQFTQTFLLSPGSKENTFDLVNDNLRFIDFGEFRGSELNVMVPPATSKPTVKNTHDNQTEKNLSEAANDSQGEGANGSSHIKNEPDTHKESSAEKPAEEKSKPEAETSSSVPAKDTSEAPAPPVKEVGDSTRVHDNDSIEQGNTTNEEQKEQARDDDMKQTSSKVSLSKPLSWAALAAQQPPPNVKTATVSTPPKPVASPPKNIVASKTVPQAQAPQASGNNVKYKKEDWFPIYIRGVKDVNEENLKSHLTEKFGDIKFFRVFLNIALCDFVDGEAQKKALDAKETTVDGITIQLEVRESKNNKTNGKNQKEKSNEKRNKNEKKLTIKKTKAGSKTVE